MWILATAYSVAVDPLETDALLAATCTVQVRKELNEWSGLLVCRRLSFSKKQVQYCTVLCMLSSGATFQLEDPSSSSLLKPADVRADSM